MLILLYLDGRDEAIPSRIFRPHVSEIIKFCRRSKGGRQYLEIEAALDPYEKRQGAKNHTRGRSRRTDQQLPYHLL